MLNYAYKNGIAVLDTGPMYGNSEEIIGEYFKKYGRNFSVCTKLPDHIENEECPTEDELENTIKNSLSKLWIDNVDCYYLHQYYQCHFPKLMQALLVCKKKGLIHRVGVSIYHPEELISICDCLHDIVDVIQIPYNVLSVGIWEAALKLAESRGITIYARSIYLQGLVFMNPEDVFIKRIGASEYIRFIQEKAISRNISVEQLCYNTVKSNKNIKEVVIGSENVEQLKKNVALNTNFCQLSDADIIEINNKMNNVPLDVLNPQTWGKYK